MDILIWIGIFIGWYLIGSVPLLVYWYFKFGYINGEDIILSIKLGFLGVLTLLSLIIIILIEVSSNLYDLISIKIRISDEFKNKIFIERKEKN